MRMHRKIIGYAAFLPTVWVAQASGAESQLEVLGKLTVQAQAEHRGSTTIEISGRLSDDAGQPTSGIIALQKGTESHPITRMCDGAPPLKSRTASVPPSGEFCFLTELSDSHLSLFAEAPHFLPTSQDVGTSQPGYLPAPRFTQAPQSIDLVSDSAVVVEVLASSGSYVHGAELALRLNCPDSTTAIDKVALAGSRLERFEFTLPEETSPGNCALEAEATAPHHSPVAQSRNVLVRAPVSIRLADNKKSDDSLEFTIDVTTTAGRVNEGLIEARSNGAFLVGAPVHDGVAQLELERRSHDYDVEFHFLPASPSLIPTNPLTVLVPAVKVGFQWATLHILLFFCFVSWLGYAWLRPRSSAARTLTIAPPREGIVRASGSDTGPIRCTVADAHTGDTLPGVMVTLVQMGTTAETIVETQVSGPLGRVEFETALRDHRLLQIEARAENYMHLRAGVLSSELTVHLTYRRRAALQNLIKWAKNQGQPWHRERPPTPGELQATAQMASNSSIETWAREIAGVAYGKSEPAETAIDALKAPASDEMSAPRRAEQSEAAES